MVKQFKKGDLIEVIQISDESSYFKWTLDLPTPGIYMGAENITIYGTINNAKERSLVHKIYAQGKCRYIHDLSEIRHLTN